MIDISTQPFNAERCKDYVQVVFDGFERRTSKKGKNIGLSFSLTANPAYVLTISEKGGHVVVSLNALEATSFVCHQQAVLHPKDLKFGDIQKVAARMASFVGYDLGDKVWAKPYPKNIADLQALLESWLSNRDAPNGFVQACEQDLLRTAVGFGMGYFTSSSEVGLVFKQGAVSAYNDGEGIYKPLYQHNRYSVPCTEAEYEQLSSTLKAWFETHRKKDS